MKDRMQRFRFRMALGIVARRKASEEDQRRIRWATSNAEAFNLLYEEFVNRHGSLAAIGDGTLLQILIDALPQIIELIMMIISMFLSAGMEVGGGLAVPKSGPLGQPVVINWGETT